MRNLVIATILVFISIPVFAVDVAPRISDREIIVGLAEVKGDIKGLQEGQRNLEKRIDDLRSEMNSRFDMLMWMIGLFVTISMVTLGFVLRMQWQMMKRQTVLETALETQKDEVAFLKGLIEKLLSPQSAVQRTT
ncbi:MAG: hypothetical protein HY786_08895 [Deltaproteobacteria bacterium]|nr:hypothetical protein [Deltaproteobacteria bacterium]